MKDTECRQRVQCIENDLEMEDTFRRDGDNELRKELHALNTRMSKTETDISLLNSQGGDSSVKEIECVHRRLTQLQCRIIDLEDAVKERTKFVNTIIDRHSHEVLNTRVKLDKHIDEQVGALGMCGITKGTIPEYVHRPNGSYNPQDNMEISMGTYPCYASSSELEKDAVTKN